MARYRSRRLARLGQGQFESFGASLWEWLHPEQRAAEYEAVGKEAPEPVTIFDVAQAAREDVLETAQAAGEQLTSGLKLARNALIGGAVLYALYLFSKGRRK